MNTTYDNTDECGSKKDSGLLITVSPYSCPKFNGPLPISNSENVGLYLAIKSPHISDLFNKYDTKPKKLKKDEKITEFSGLFIRSKKLEYILSN